MTKVPIKPPSNVEEVRNQYDQTLVRQLEEVGAPLSQSYIRTSQRHIPHCKFFQTRPVWTRAALLNQFTAAQAREIHKYVANSLVTRSANHLRTVAASSKVFLPLTCYVFGDGPWRDTMVRFGYDPRQDPQARLSARPALTCRCINQEIKLSKAILPKSQPSHWSRIGSITTAGKSRRSCFHEPFIDRTSS